jgi:hypothetical protein
MAKNPEVMKYVSDLTKAQDSVRFANEELIKLSQRFGRMVPKFQKMDSKGILTWFAQYNRIKDSANRANDGIKPLLESEEAIANPMISTQLAYYNAQKSRYYFKIEVMDDILNGVVEDLLDSSALDESQKEEMRAALDETMGRSKKVQEPCTAGA